MFTLPGKTIFSPSKPKIQPAPAPAPPPPEISDDEVQKAGKDEAALRRRRGRGQTILAGASLTDDETQVAIERAKLGNS